MARVVFELSSGRDGVVQLRDCAFTEVWKDVFKKNNNQIGVRPPTSWGQTYDRDNDAERKRRHYQSFKYVKLQAAAVQLATSGIEAVRSMSLPWTRKMPHLGMQWSDANDIHRGFTTLSITMCTDRIDLTHDEKNALMISQNDYHGAVGRELLMQYSKTPLPELRLNPNSTMMQHFQDSLHNINSGVHKAEKYISTQRELDIFSSIFPGKECNIPLLDWNNKDPSDNITDAIRADHELGDVAKWAVDNDPHWNVYDLKNILGKDYLTAYYNYDDPGEWDVCNTFKTTKGGFEILPHMHRVVNEILVPWIRDDWGYHAFPETVSPIQIGHIDEQELLDMCTPSEFNSWDISHNHIVKVDLVE